MTKNGKDGDEMNKASYLGGQSPRDRAAAEGKTPAAQRSGLSGPVVHSSALFALSFSWIAFHGDPQGGFHILHDRRR